MTLIQMTQFTREEIKRLKQEQNPDAKRIETNEQLLSWLDELFRFRLFLSEFTREIQYLDESQLDKEWLLNFIDGEVEDWRLKGIYE